MKDMSDQFPLSDDGRWWWDGHDWQLVPEQWLNAGEAERETIQINADEYPALARILRFADDIDQYLVSIGIDPAEIPEPPLEIM